MATASEEIFMEGLIEQSPQSSQSVFLDVFSPKHDAGCECCHHNVPSDMMLPYISRMLMEDDSDDNKLSDHPALLQVQQPFAQILSSPSFCSNNGDTDAAKDLLQDDGVDERTVNQALSEGTYAVGAFLKGMEEANMFLPGANGFRNDEQVNEMVRESHNHNHSGAKKRHAIDDHLEEEARRRTSKSMVMMIKEPRDIYAHDSEMLDDMMSRGYEAYVIRGMKNLRIAMAANEVEIKTSRKNSRRRSANVVDIHTILILCAQAVGENDQMRARELLKQIKQHASKTGDVTQRLAQCFSKGLEARLVGTGSQAWQLLVADNRLSLVEVLKAQNLYMAASSFNKVVLYFSTMTILQAMVGKTRLHIVDYGLRYGLHWAHLLRLLVSREGGPPKVKITAIGQLRLRPCPGELIEETGSRLSKCAHELGVPFTFHAIRKNLEEVSIEDLDTDPEEVLIVNDHFNFSTLMDESIFFDEPSPKDTVLHNIRKMRPDVFIQSILNSSFGSSYVSRFREALFYYTAMFDMFDATIPRCSKSRVVLEQELFGRFALNVVACEGTDLMERPEKYKQWQVRNQRAGLRQLPLEPDIVNLLKEKVGSCHHKDFLICEDGQWLLQGWMGRVLIGQSTWVADEVS